MKRIIIMLLTLLLLTGCAAQKSYRLQQAETENAVRLSVPELCQYPALPTGCEATAAAMVLQFYGKNISPAEFAEEYLIRDNGFYYSEGRLYGPDPNEVFAGDPFGNNGYGCYAPAIANSINRNLPSFSATLLTGQTVAELCANYTDVGKPLLLWVTMSMRPSSEGGSWYLYGGEKFTWTAGEHCMVLCGYDEEFYFLADPESGSTVGYKKSIVEQRFSELGRMAVYIYEDEAL